MLEALGILVLCYVGWYAICLLWLLGGMLRVWIVDRPSDRRALRRAQAAHPGCALVQLANRTWMPRCQYSGFCACGGVVRTPDIAPLSAREWSQMAPP